MKKLLAMVLMVGVLAAGCSSVSGNIGKDVLAEGKGKGGLFSGVIMRGLQDASWNLDQAVAVGALKADDPAPKCLHGILTQLGIDPTVPVVASPSFEPKRSDLISEGSVLYIRAQQIRAAQGSGIQVPMDCKQFIGQLMLDAAAAGSKGVPGGGFIVPFR